jgi:peptidoglycan hydrolase CwlO-like protein
MPDGRLAGRGRLVAFVAPIVLLGLVALPAAADSTTDPATAVTRAQAQLHAARAQAAAQDNALAATQQDLAASQQRLAALQAEVARLDAQLQRDAAAVDRLQAQLATDRGTLAHFLRGAYQRGLDAPFLYLLSADNFSTMMQRQVQVSKTADAARSLVARIGAEQAQAQRMLETTRSQRAALETARQQAVTTAALVAVEESRLTSLDDAAHAAVSSSQQTLTQALSAKAKADAAAAAAAAAARAAAARAKPGPGVIFGPVPGLSFTVDTNLTLPSGETADRLNQFLAGTVLAGLGPAFMTAERDHHVSARYLVAHAIEESAWGTSQIAQVKHNLFGFGANDTHPFQDAVTFPSFAACIDTVSAYIGTNYLSPAGRYYHGPTLRGMNVAYASDPRWAANIAAIAVTIP